MGGAARRQVRGGGRGPFLVDACALAGIPAASVTAACLGSSLRPGGPGSGAGCAGSPRAASSGGGEQHRRRRRGWRRRLTRPCRPAALRSDAGAATRTTAFMANADYGRHCRRGRAGPDEFASEPGRAAPFGMSLGGSLSCRLLGHCLLFGPVSPPPSGLRRAAGLRREELSSVDLQFLIPTLHCTVPTVAEVWPTGRL